MVHGTPKCVSGTKNGDDGWNNIFPGAKVQNPAGRESFLGG